MRRHRICLLAALALALTAREAGAGTIGVGEAAAESARCVDAIHRAAQASGVPAALLLALAPTESGLPRAQGRGSVYPWPWTLNTNGSGSLYFRTRSAAEKHLNALVATGNDNVDIGCLQVNWRWHRGAFAAPAAALDPERNVRYAAQLLRSYRRQTGSWAAAVGMYHSRNPTLAELYRCQVAHALQPKATLKNCPF